MKSMRLPDFQPVAAGQIASIKIPRYAATVLGLTLTLGGTSFTKAMIRRIALKIGTRTVWQFSTFGAVSGGTMLDRVNKNKGYFDQASNISAWFFDRNMETGTLKDVGGYDMSKLSDDLYFEVDIDPTAIAPTLSCNCYYTDPQGATPEDPTGQLVAKFISVPYSFAGAGKFTIPFEPKASIVRGLYVMYSGADGTATTNGVIQKVEVKKDGVTQWEHDDKDNRFAAQEIGRRIPQSKCYAVDFCLENYLKGALITADAKAISIEMTTSAADTGVVMFELLDAPYNVTN